MSTADKWADSHAVGGGTVQSKQAEREELARQMAEFEKRQGPVKETPIIVRDSKPNRISNNAKKKPLTPLQEKTLKLLREGVTSINKISKAIGTSNGNISYSIDRLIERGLAEKIEKGHYEAVENVENC